MRSSTRDRIIVGMDANLTSEPRIDKEWGPMDMEDNSVHGCQPNQ